MKVGDYVRTPLGITKYLGKYKMFDGSIAENLHEFDGLDESLWSGDLYGVVFDCDLEDVVLKSSPNIIDLIEVGDYVNGCPVLYKENNELVCGLLLKYKEENIENIVTHEQFESMQYNLESQV